MLYFYKNTKNTHFTTPAIPILTFQIETYITDLIYKISCQSVLKHVQC